MNAIMPAIRRNLPGRRGQALIELAILTPVLLVVVVGLIDVGRFARVATLVGNAAHAGAQYGTQSLSTAADRAGMRTAAVTDGQSLSGLSASATNLCICADGSACSTPQLQCAASTHRILSVQVTASGTFQTLLRYPGLPQQMTISRVAVLQVAP